MLEDFFYFKVGAFTSVLWNFYFWILINTWSIFCCWNC